MKLNNYYFLLRHGQALSNLKSVCSSFPETFENPLTDVGVRMVEHAARELQDKNIEMIFSSDLLRAKQTSEIVGKALNIKPIPDARLREYSFGVLNGNTITAFNRSYPDDLTRFEVKPDGGENYTDITNRMYAFLQEMEKQYSGKNILVVSHEVPITLLICKVEGLTPQETFMEHFNKTKIKNAEVKYLNGVLEHGI